MNCQYCKTPTPNSPRICDTCETLNLDFRPAIDGSFSGFAVMSRHPAGDSLLVMPSMGVALDHTTGGIEGLSVTQAQQIIVEVIVKPLVGRAWMKPEQETTSERNQP